MFFIPYLSIVVFCLMLIPLIYYGFKKGWVYSLCFSIVLWSITLIFIGINYGLYKHLWTLYKNTVLESQIKIKLDVDNLSSFYKTQIILFAVGVEFIIIYPLTFLTMMFVNKFIYKYFGHKIKDISVSKKEIVKKRNLYASRGAGGLILTTSSLFAASLMVSAINIITTPHKKAYGINKFNDVFGNVYSLGLANNSESAQIISEFLRDELDSKLAESLKELIHFESSEQQNVDNYFPDLQKIKFFEDNFSRFYDLFKNEKATLAILSSVIYAGEKSFNPLTFDQQTAISTKDSNNNQVGYNKTQYLNNMAALIKFVQKNKLKIHLSEHVIDLLTEKFFKNFVDFSDTVFYKNKEKSEQRLKDLKKDLKEKQSLRLSLYKDLSKFKNERKQIIEWMMRVSGQNTFGGNYNSDSALSFTPNAVQRQDISNGTITSGTLYDEISEEKRLETIKDNKNNVKNQKTTVHTSHFSGDYSSTKSARDIALSNRDNAKRDLKYKVDQKTTEESNKRTNENSIASWNAKIKSWQSTIASKNGEINKSDGDLQKLNVLKSNKKQALSDINSLILTLTTQLNTLTVGTKAHNDKQIEINNENSKKQKLNDDLREINDKMLDLINKKISLQKNIDFLNSQIDDAKDEIVDLNRYIFTNISNIQKFSQEIDSLRTTLKLEESKLNQAEILFEAEEEIEKRNKREKESAINDYRNAYDAHNNQTQKINSMIVDYRKKQSELSSKNNIIASTRKKLDVLENVNNTFKFKSPAKVWAHSSQNDKSIFYCQEIVKFQEDKNKQLIKIRDQKENIYNINKVEILSLYRKYLGE